jgi:predicted RNA-binding Zn-ribbon protein involved in translation (DUF1610 family)
VTLVTPTRCVACGVELTAEQMAVAILCPPCLVRARDEAVS